MQLFFIGYFVGALARNAYKMGELDKVKTKDAFEKWSDERIRFCINIFILLMTIFFY